MKIVGVIVLGLILFVLVEGALYGIEVMYGGDDHDPWSGR